MWSMWTEFKGIYISDNIEPSTKFLIYAPYELLWCRSSGEGEQLFHGCGLTAIIVMNSNYGIYI